MYYITEVGQAYLDAWVQAAKEYRRVIDTLSRAYTSRSTPRSSERGDEVF
jgi:DNA-binding PadR family transcriptional regulator